MGRTSFLAKLLYFFLAVAAVVTAIVIFQERLCEMFYAVKELGEKRANRHGSQDEDYVDYIDMAD